MLRPRKPKANFARQVTSALLLSLMRSQLLPRSER
jgi:hypothetical protein